ALAISAGAALLAWQSFGAAGLHWSAIGVAGLAAPFFARDGERLGTSALVHCAIALAVIALAVNGPGLDELAICAALLALCALALENALVGLFSSLCAVSIGALLIGGPAALTGIP